MSAALAVAEPDGPPALDGLDPAWTLVDGYRLHRWLGGPVDGPPIVLVHGFLGTGWSWRDVAPVLVRRGHRVLVVDLLGFGDSDKPDGTQPYTGPALVHLLRGLAAAVGLDGPLLVVGHDMGAPPALLWAADHPDEVAAVVYVEAPTMLDDPLREVFTYTRQAMAQGSMWWWLVPLAPGVPEALVVGHERSFLEWFYRGPSGAPAVFDDDVVAQLLRTFTGPNDVLGSMGVYRAAFDTIDATERLRDRPVRQPVVSVAGGRGLGEAVASMLGPVTLDLTSHVIPGCGHFVPEESAEELADIILRTAAQTTRSPASAGSSVGTVPEGHRP